MKQIILFILLITSPIYSQSISELCLIHETSGKIIHFYDSPLYFLELVGDDQSTLLDIRLNKSKEIREDEYYLKARYIPSIYSVSGVIQNYYTIDTLRVNYGFRTIRGIGIGSSQEEVIEKYPNSKLFREGSFYWQNIDWVYEKGKELPSEIDSMAIFWNFGKWKRVPELNMDIIYGFKFYFNNQGHVDEIELSFLLTAL